MKTFLKFFACFLLLTLNAFSSSLFVSCAMGVRELSEDLGKEFQDKEKVKVLFNFSSSGKLAKQIELGVPCDLFISASKCWVDYLKEKGLIDKGTIKPFVKTKLVLVTPKNYKFESLEKVKRLAVGDKLSPVGKYALETLKNLGLYEKLKNRLIFAPTVRHVAVWVATGNVDGGIIYYSDYLKFKENLRLVKVFSDSLHEPIVFYVGVVNYSDKKSLAKKFEEFLLSQEEERYEKYGFFKVGRGE